MSLSENPPGRASTVAVAQLRTTARPRAGSPPLRRSASAALSVARLRSEKPGERGVQLDPGDARGPVQAGGLDLRASDRKRAARRTQRVGSGGREPAGEIARFRERRGNVAVYQQGRLARKGAAK